jgi:hypothetical protein
VARRRSPPSADDGRPDWLVAKHVLERAFAARAPRARVVVGKTSRIGEGLDRVAFAAYVELHPDPTSLGGPCVVLLPRQPNDDSTRREAPLLDRLAGLGLPFEVPPVVAVPTPAARCWSSERSKAYRFP